jgi:hypothetical protein
VPRNGRDATGPTRPNDAPPLVADGIFPALRGEDGVTGVLPRHQQPPVLDPPVELPDEAVLLPREVGAADDGSERRPHLELQR